MATQYDLCLVTAGDRETADKLASGLVEERLAACVTVLPGARSVYRWKGKIEAAEELLLVVKTRRSLREDVERFVKRHHSYETPETIFAEIAAGSAEYLDWLGANTVHSTEKPEAPGKN